MDNRKTEVVNEEESLIMDESINDSRKTVVAATSFDRSTICIGEENSPVGADDLLGKQIDGQYIFDRVLSVNSGQSIVYIVKHLRDNKEYVCKLYRSDATVIDSSVVEALAYKINCPYVIKIVKYGVFENRFYTITPLYREGSVIEHIEEIDSSLLKEKYIEQLNEGLKAIHEAGIFHCDIKPHNIFFSEDRNKLVFGDFGIALSSSSFNTIKTTDGEAIAKRDLQKNNATIAYLALEGDEYATKAVDYFALGMTILNMAYKGDVYSEIPDKAVRDRIVLEGVRIPDTIDKEIAALVLKMTETDPKKRIGYDGVKKWCLNNAVYGRYTKIANNLCPANISSAVFDGVVYNSTEDYTNAILSNPKKGLEYYLRDGIVNDLARSDANRDFIHEISTIKSKYNENPVLGLALTLLTLNPTISFAVGEKVFGNFKGYIEYLDTALLKKSEIIFDESILLKEIDNEIKTKRLNSEGEIMTLCSNIFSSKYELSYKQEMLRNFFTSKNTLILDKEEYTAIGHLASALFDTNIKPLDKKHIFNKLFFDYLIRSNEDMKSNQELLNEIFSEKDSFKRNAQFAILLSNGIPTTIDNYKIRCFADIVNYAKELYESNKNSKNLCSFLKDGTILKYVSEFPEAKEDEIALLSKLKNSKENDYNLLAEFYNKTQEFAILIVDDIKIQSLEDLYKTISKTKNIEELSDTLVGSTRFHLWLDKMGYKDSVEYLAKASKR